MKKILYVAVREFIATVATKGFILGMLLPPVMIGIMVIVFPILITKKPPAVSGEVAVIDPTSRIATSLREYLSPEAIARRHDETLRRGMEAAPEAVKQLAGKATSDPAAKEAMEAAVGSVPNLRIAELPPVSSVEAEKESLKGAPAVKGDDKGRIALVVIHPDAVVRQEGKPTFGSYDLYLRGKLDDRIDDEIRGGLREAIVSARISEAGYDRERIDALTRVGRVKPTIVTEKGESTFSPELNIFIPMGLAVLLLMSVMTGSQALMTTTIEEKSSRVVEVLLSAVSPVQLMTGKILGQMGVGLVVLALYAGAGLFALTSFALLGLVDLSLIFYLVIFFLITYFVMAAMMGAIGAAVNELREAQTLMTPVMLVMLLPWILWFPISRSPNSLFSIIVSLLPPMNGFAMLLRMASTAPPPAWQVWLSIGIGAASVYVALWFAGKVFRIGLLMYGKPPNFATLIRWVRMA